MIKKTSISSKILIAMMLGLLLGSVVNVFFSEVAWLQSYLVDGLFYVVGAAFVNALKMLVVPLVIFSLICGVCGIGDVSVLGRIGVKAFALYVLTTGMAIVLALLIAIIVAPGQGFERVASVNAFIPPPAPPLTDVLANIVPSNPIHAFAEGNMLQIIFFVIVFAIAMLMCGDIGRELNQLAEKLNEVMMKVVTLVMDVAPVGVFCLMAKTFSEQGFGLIVPMIGYFSVVIAALLLHAFGTLSLLLVLFAKLNPLVFIKKMRPAHIFAFSTASSNATIPVTLQVVEQRLGVNNATAAFTIPLGATVNMDGTAIMQGVATVFIANVYGIDLGLGDYATVVGMSILASIGTAGVPGVGLIMLAMVFNQVGLPAEGIGLILGVDRLLDMVRTAVNVTGDAAVTCIVARGENELDDAVFNDPEAGVIIDIELPHKHPLENSG
ncbi:MAG: dicarboxylate/amino acid:cation symporter [Methylobacter sp.]|nr:dicarboxylate/amino acid:cation symporter [Methylobacter sp.]MDP2097307.1 dicarboxylate/amino acid:cation symporter [Methylobacter sp.]MDP2428369.1 dicarboxylate/amino acid:cation symporter [Methylobacter sp.]MDP3053212.1 dicarboxylate/amino acid:cation symporter [Methylobacter sp.]MDP3361154.1 dicarboxylate/amino acid:cation symporter [Methylobacter sp.]